MILFSNKKICFVEEKFRFVTGTSARGRSGQQREGRQAKPLD
jgi:hypothetical protein